MLRLRRSLPALTAILLLISPGIAMSVTQEATLDKAFISAVAAIAFFLIPVGFFGHRLRLYLYLLFPLILLTPVFLFSVYYFWVPPGFELIAFVMQTNPREASEAITPLLLYFIPLEISFAALYIYCIRLVRANTVPFRWALAVSVAAISVLCLITVFKNQLYDLSWNQVSKRDLLLKYDYPFTLMSGAIEARGFLKKNNLRAAENFTFKAVRNDTLPGRQVYVLIIGESSRHDRWQVNGYGRPTSPRLQRRSNLIAYRDVVAGAHYTWVSVPQIITRANPDNYDLQFREKSILGVFQEAGFQTYWLSNQSDQDIFWSGSIILHAKTADYYCFSPTYSPNLEFENVYDGRLLPLLDSVLRADRHDLFITLHMMGNHWEYNRRYPPSFDVFQPSQYADEANPTSPANREAINNAYDNSILYSDYLVDSVISLVERSAEVAAVTFISDHGEDLFDAHEDHADFHFRPSASTLRVPLFIWTSEGYDRAFPHKRQRLEASAGEKVGTENIFYTISDIANLSMDGFDPARSLAHPAFQPSPQKYYGDDHRGHYFSQLP